MENKLIGYADDSTLIAVVPSPGVIVSRTKAMIVSRSRTMLSQSPPLTIGGTVLKESDGLVILGVTFNFKMTFGKHLHSFSRATSQDLVS